MAAWMVYATGVAALVGLGAVALDRWARPHGRPVRFAWAGAVVLGAVLPLVAVQAQPVGAFLVGLVAGSVSGPATGGVVFLDPLVVGGGPAALTSPALDAALAVLWATGSLGLFGWWMAARRRLRVRLRDASPSGDPPGGDGTVLVTRDIGPAVVGVLRPRILVPHWLADGDPERLALALGHEREHVSAGDPTLLAGSFLVCAAFPWNPVLWWMVRRLQEAVEVDCDRRVLERRPEALSHYADTLLAVSARSASPAQSGAVALVEPTSLLERRIRTMTAPRPKHPVLRGLLLAGLATVALALACSAPSPEQEAETPTEPATTAEGAPSRSPDSGEAPAPVTEGGDVSEIADGPTFTPYTVPPELKNRSEVAKALEEEYPPLLREAGIGGTTEVWFLLDDEGRVQRTRVRESSGREALDLGALRVAELIEFTPAFDGSDPVPVWIAIPVTFQPG